MLGFVLPLIILLTLESTVALLLLAPRPFNRPAIALCKLSKTQVGATVVYTVSAFLLILLASPIYDATRLYYATRDKAHLGLDEGEDQAAKTQLSAFLTTAALLMMYLLRNFGITLAENDRMRTSEEAILKQVAGLQDAYNRLSSVSEGGGAPGGGDTARTQALQGQLEEAKTQAAALQEDKEAADRARKTAVNNADALKSQYKGLENEYDRLLAENDELKRQLSRAGGAAQPSGTFVKKDA